jgi:hypothetical protein
MSNIYKTTCLYISLSLLFGCEGDFDPRTKLSGYRVIGIEAEPPEVNPDGQIELIAHEFNESDTEVTYEWKLCIYSLGPATDFECTQSELEFNIGDTSRVDLDLGADGIGLRRLIEKAAPIVGPDGTERTLRTGIDLLVSLNSGPTNERNKRIRTIKRIHVRENNEEAANTNPVIRDFTVDGESDISSAVELRVETSQPESYIDALTGEKRTEEFLYTWYTSAGETDPGITFGKETKTQLELPSESQEIEVIVAVRDGRGGLSVERLSYRIE